MSQKPAKFGPHRHCGSGDTMLLVCHMMLKDHVIKISCELNSWMAAPHGKSPHYQAIGIAVVEI